MKNALRHPFSFCSSMKILKFLLGFHFLEKLIKILLTRQSFRPIRQQHPGNRFKYEKIRTWSQYEFLPVNSISDNWNDNLQSLNQEKK